MDARAIPETSQWPQVGAVTTEAYRVSDSVVDMRRTTQKTRDVLIQALPQNVLLDLNKSALVIIDMQNDFCAPGGWIASMGIDVGPALALAAPINQTTRLLRAQGVPIVWVNWGVRPDRLNLSPGTQHAFNPAGQGPGLSGEVVGAPRKHNLLQKGSWGAQVIDSLDQDTSDIFVDKHRISGFWDTPLNAILSNLGVKTLLFAGVNADHCVLGTLMDANFHGYDTILLEDCTATTSPDFCMEATLHNVRFCFGFTTTSEDLGAGVTAGQ